uniref:hypothetical protein n=1 Tax=Salmonella sp. SAL4457 TaxID=3159912 RepID=UPI00397D4558
LLETRVTGFDGDPGVASWDSDAPGYLTIQEELTDGYGTPVVYCDTYYPFDEQVPEYQWIETEGALMEYDLAERYSLI